MPEESPLGQELKKRESPLFEDFDGAIIELQTKFDSAGSNHQDWKSKANILLAEMNSIYERVEDDSPIVYAFGQSSPRELIDEADALLDEAKEFES